MPCHKPVNHREVRQAIDHRPPMESESWREMREPSLSPLWWTPHFTQSSLTRPRKWSEPRLAKKLRLCLINKMTNYTWRSKLSHLFQRAMRVLPFKMMLKIEETTAMLSPMMPIAEVPTQAILETTRMVAAFSAIERWKTNSEEEGNSESYWLWECMRKKGNSVAYSLTFWREIAYMQVNIF